MSKPKNSVSKRDILAGLVHFGFEGEPVRMVMECEMPWFNANDVCQALGYENSRKALADHVDDEDRNTVTIRYGILGFTHSSSPLFPFCCTALFLWRCSPVEL